MKILKNMMIMVICTLLATSALGCHPADDTGTTTTATTLAPTNASTTNVPTTLAPTGNAFIPEFSQIQSITVLVFPEVPPEDGMGIIKREDGTIEEIKGFDTLTEIRDPDEIVKILRMFDGWEMTKVPEDQLLDSACMVFIRIGDQVTLGFVEKTARGYYGRVESTICYLPEGFGAYMEELLKSKR